MAGMASEVLAYTEAAQGTVTRVTPHFIPTPTLHSTTMIPRMPQRTGERYPSLWALQSVGAGRPLGVNGVAYSRSFCRRRLKAGEDCGDLCSHIERCALPTFNDIYVDKGMT
jgi:hypothetical protein